MVTIIIATDFSKASHKASKYGIELASAIGADIVLLHVYSLPVTLPEPLFPVSAVELKNAAESLLLNEVTELRKSSLQPIEIIAEEGGQTEVILATAAKYKSPLIICGLKSDNKGIKKIIGTTPMDLLKNSEIPLLLVPEQFEYKPIERIAFATDIELTTDMRSLDLLENIGEQLHSKMYIVRIVKENMSVVGELTFRSSRLLDKFKNLEPEYVFPKSSDVTTGLQNFSTEYKIDLLAMISKKHSFADRLFIKSESKSEIYHTHIPLLLLHEIKSVYKTQKTSAQKEFK